VSSPCRAWRRSMRANPARSRRMSEGGVRHPGVREIARAVQNRESTALQQVRTIVAGLVRAETSPDSLNAFIRFGFATAEQAAERIDRSDVSSLPLAGVPVAVKDNICTLEYPTTCGSRVLGNYRSPYEATVVRRLRAAGGIVAGKTNMDEF